MYHQLEYLAMKRMKDLRREAEQERLAAAAVGAQPAAPSALRHLAAGSLLWTGELLSYWGNQLQGQQAS